MVVATRRLASFYKIVSLSSYKLSVELKELLEAGVSGDCCESILENAITCLRLELMWGVHALQDTTTPNRVSVSVLKAGCLVYHNTGHSLALSFPIFGKGRHTCLHALSEL